MYMTDGDRRLDEMRTSCTEAEGMKNLTKVLGLVLLRVHVYQLCACASQVLRKHLYVVVVLVCSV